MTLTPAIPAEQMLENVRSALGRGLPETRRCRAHSGVLSVAGGGPSFEDTWGELDGCIAAVNGSLGYLLDKGRVPHLCGLVDASEKLADIVRPHSDVVYYVASVCHPKVFDRLSGCDVRLWHPSGVPGIEAELQGDWLAIGGGTTIGLRWINLGYILGFRRFWLFGLDSSFDRTTHAYPDNLDFGMRMRIDGYTTRVDYYQQVEDFFELLKTYSQPGMEPFEIRMFGDGLLQHRWAQYREENPAAFTHHAMTQGNGNEPTF